eukprot:Clim_evm30s109 gene=Clim_evmTU30s109
MLANQKHEDESLAVRLGIDFVSASGAAFLVSPLVCTIDRAIISNASGSMKMKDSIIKGLTEFVTNPAKAFSRREFLLIWGVYTATYVTANTIMTVAERMDKDAGWPKFLGTTVVNLVTCIGKDREFTRMFGTVAPKPLPVATYGLFAVRDSMTIGASFNAPKYASAKIRQTFGEENISRQSADNVAQLFCPAVVQFASTPIHLLGLDLYNNPGASAASRIAQIRSTYIGSALARIGRIGPAFGFGGIGNTYFRKGLQHQLLGHSWN